MAISLRIFQFHCHGDGVCRTSEVNGLPGDHGFVHGYLGMSIYRLPQVRPELFLAEEAVRSLRSDFFFLIDPRGDIDLLNSYRTNKQRHSYN